MNNTPRHILLAEDEPILGKVLKECLETEGYQVIHQYNGKDALKSFCETKPDLCLFDVNMPGQDGFSLAQEVKAISVETPIIFLTARSLKEDVIKGLKIGADDYIKKPFSVEELLLRIEGVFRRTMPKVEVAKKIETRFYTIGPWKFDAVQSLLVSDTQSVKVPPKESDLLKLLCQNRDTLLSRERIMMAIWQDDDYFKSRILDVYISKLRKYFKHTDEVTILNVRGKGLRLFVEED